MSLTNLILWSVAGWLFGILLFFLVPMTYANLGGYDRRKAMADKFFTWSMGMMRQAALIERTNEWILAPSKTDAEMDGALRIDVNGKTGHADDVGGLTARLHNRPLSAVSDKRNAVTDPMVADIGEKFGELVENAEDTQTLKKGEETVEAIVNTLDIEAGSRLVSLASSTWVIPGSGDLFLGERSKDFAEKSQAGFVSRRTAEYMIILIAYGVGFGLPVIAITQLGAGGGGDVINVRMPSAILPVSGVLS